MVRRGSKGTSVLTETLIDQQDGAISDISLDLIGL